MPPKTRSSVSRRSFLANLAAAGVATMTRPSFAQPATDAPIAPNEPGAEAAIAVLRDYYAAINAHDFARAHALWRQNPQTVAQFADGFAGTAGVSVEIGAPGPIDAGAGQRFIEIPVRLDATQQDGRVEAAGESAVDKRRYRVIVHGPSHAFLDERIGLRVGQEQAFTGRLAEKVLAEFDKHFVTLGVSGWKRFCEVTISRRAPRRDV